MKDPIILFSQPRGGSTLFLRLLNKCKDADGKRVVFRGESNDLLRALMQARRCMLKTTGYNNSGEFGRLAHLNPSEEEDINVNLATFIQYWAKAGENPWGFKEVNYGQHGYKNFMNTLRFLKDLYPESKIIINTRDTDEVFRSQIDTGWWGKNEEIVRRDILSRDETFKALATKQQEIPVIKTDYRDLLTFESFYVIAVKLGLTISLEDYKAERENKIRK